MRIHIGESDRWHGKPLEETIVELLRNGTIQRRHGAARHRRLQRLSTPTNSCASHRICRSFELVEASERIEPTPTQLDPMIGGGLVALEKVHVILYRSHK